VNIKIRKLHKTHVGMHDNPFQKSVRGINP